MAASHIFDSSNVRASRDVNIYGNILSRRDPMEMIEDQVALGELHDSAEHYDPPKCHPQTRRAVLKFIDQWALDKSPHAIPIMWLSGSAGAGKSAIAQTLVEGWKEQDRFVSSFFFWRSGAQRNSKTHLVPTIAYQLAVQCRSLKPLMGDAVLQTAILHKALCVQLETLVINPIVTLPTENLPVIIVIDGLDECSHDLPGQTHESQQKEILDAISFVCRKNQPPFPFKFLIASRPERQIRESFDEGPLKKCTVAFSLKDVIDASADIQLFLDWKFQDIRQRLGLDPLWPSEAQLWKLVNAASGQFIYPSVVMRYIGRPRGDPVKSLDAVLQLQTGSSDNPLKELDALYTFVVKSVASDSRRVAEQILTYMTYSGKMSRIFLGNVTHNSPNMFGKLLFLSNGEIYNHLTDLHSVLDIPPPNNVNSPIKFMHATLREYLSNRSRCGDLFVSAESFELQCSVVLLRHVQTMIADHGNLLYCEEELVEQSVAYLRHCSPSPNALSRFWWSIEVDIGHYSIISFAPTKRSCSNDQLLPFHPQDNQMYAIRRCKWELLHLIQRCNTPEIVPSWWKRFLIARHLKRAINKLGPVLPKKKHNALLWPERAPTETRSSDGETVD